MADIGYGATYEIWDASLSTPAFVEVSEVISITPGSATADRVEVTHMKSPGRRRQYLSGLIDSGEATVEFNLTPGDATDVLVRDLLTSGDVVEHRITFPNGQQVTYDAVITGYERSIPVDDRMVGTVTVAVSGDETWGTAA